MNLSEILALYDQHQRMQIQHPDMRKDAFPHLVRFIRSAPGTSFVSYSRLDPAQADTQIDEQLAYFKENHLPFSWTVFEHDPPPDLKERLAARGLKVYDPVDVMVLDLADMPLSLLRPAAEILPPGAELSAITRVEQLKEVEGVLQQVWGGSFAWIQEHLSSGLRIPGYLYIAAVFADGLAASVGWVDFHPGNPFANLHGGATLPGYRGRGFYTALLAARAQEARSRGFRFLTIDAGPMSRPIAQMHGFQLLARACDCELP
jgi:GNAT superfamily N-acetyltransferase